MQENKTRNVSNVTKHNPSIFAIVVEKVLLSIVYISITALAVGIILFPIETILIAFVAFMVIMGISILIGKPWPY